MAGLLALAFAMAAGAADTGGIAQLRQIDLQSSAQGAVLTLTLSGPVQPHVFHLHNPERAVIDLPATRAMTGLPAVAAGGAVTALRAGHIAPRGLRLVLDLSSPMNLHQQTIPSRAWTLRVALQSAAASPTSAKPSVKPSQSPSSTTPPSSPSAPPSPSPSPSPPPSQAPGREEAVASVRARHAPSEAGRAVVIAVDAGHGGDDPGATGFAGTHEKDVTLAIARELAARINREPGMRAVLTRDGDYFVELVERRRRATAAHADMFISIHADAIRDREVSGASVYVLSERGASSQTARILAEEQNAADLKGGISLANQKPELRSVLLDLSQNASIGESSEAADRVLGALDGVGAVRKREVQRAAFVVLKPPDDSSLIPSMLIETAYISNPAEERMLRAPAHQQRLAEAILGGIGSYFKKFPPDGSLFARARAADAAAEPIARNGS